MTDEAEIPDDALPRGCERQMVGGRRVPVVGFVALERVIGRGGTSVVFRGRHLLHGGVVALKLVAEGEAVDDPRLAIEAPSPHLLHATANGIDEATGATFVIRPYVAGIAADEWSLRARTGGGVAEAAALRVALAATRGLAALHVAGWLHRDVSPGNVLIPFGAGREPDLDRAMLGDLGHLSRPSAAGRLEGRQPVVVTFDFAAPEGLTNPTPPSRASDVFSMAATLYALLCGRSPFTGNEDADTVLNAAAGRYLALDRVRSDLTVATRTLVSQCLAVQPSRRPPDAAELARRLEACLASSLAG